MKFGIFDFFEIFFEIFLTRGILVIFTLVAFWSFCAMFRVYNALGENSNYNPHKLQSIRSKSGQSRIVKLTNESQLAAASPCHNHRWSTTCQPPQLDATLGVVGQPPKTPWTARIREGSIWLEIKFLNYFLVEKRYIIVWAWVCVYQKFIYTWYISWVMGGKNPGCGIGENWKPDYP